MKIIIDKRVLSKDWTDLFTEYYYTESPTLPGAGSIGCLPIFYVILGHANHWHLLVRYKNESHIIDSTNSVKSGLRNVWNMSSIPAKFYHFTNNQSDSWSCGYHCLDMLMTFLQEEIECTKSQEEQNIDQTIAKCKYPSNGPSHLKIIERPLLRWGEIATNDADVVPATSANGSEDDIFESIKSPAQQQVSDSLNTKIESCDMNLWNNYCSTKFSENMYVRIADIKMTGEELRDFQVKIQTPDFEQEDCAKNIQRVFRGHQRRKSFIKTKKIVRKLQKKVKRRLTLKSYNKSASSKQGTSRKSSKQSRVSSHDT
jgi:phage anti-repressor protein